MKQLKKWPVILLSLCIFGSLMSCNLVGDEDKEEEKLAIKGEWDLSYPVGDTVRRASIVVTNDTYAYHSDGVEQYRYEIVSFDNDSWNGGEEDEGNYGHMVIRYETDNPLYSESTKGKYTVFRWRNLSISDEATTMDFSEGFYAEGWWDDVSGYFDSSDEAFKGATDAAGYFSVYETSVPKMD